MQAPIDNLCFGTNTKEDQDILPQEFLSVCQEHNLRNKLEKCEFLRE